jgi:glutathione synthase/RimK-type ligase-like ATP-grasp enzyme
LQRAGIDTAALWRSICAVVVKTLLACEPSIPAQCNSFEVYGFDVLIDAALRVWLIEVNASPQMDRPHALDKRIKEALIKVCVLPV